MTNLLAVLPELDIQAFSHILPSLEKALVSAADLLTLDAVDIARRAQVPLAEVKKLNIALLDGLHASTAPSPEYVSTSSGEPTRRHAPPISTLDDGLDALLDGGIGPGGITEFVGERYTLSIIVLPLQLTRHSAAGKTQILLTLLLSIQLNAGRSALYISTEAPLQTTRLSQILQAHPKLRGLPEEQKPSLERIHSTHIHDLEAQDHILRYQVPVLLRRHNVGLLIIDSIAANYRPEFDKGKVKRTAAESFVKRSNQVSQLGALLWDVARTHDIAVVVANQVSDRFAAFEPSSQMLISQQTQRSRHTSPTQSNLTGTSAMCHTMPLEADSEATMATCDDPLALDHQQRFFTGWGDDLVVTNLKTPSLGLAWTNQLSTRVALLKEPIIEMRPYKPGEEPNLSGWKRTLRVVFSDRAASGDIKFEIAQGGVRSIETGAGDWPQ
jgi:DNA repair protein RAD57